MIKLFKHIRKDLMEQNKTGKYFKYAIGEIVLVVIGILIALQINNWNEERKNQNRANELTEKLKIELAQNIDYLNFTYNAIEHQTSFLQMVLNADAQNIDSIMVKSRFDLSPLFYMSSYSTFFDPPSDIYETAINDGSIRLIKDKALSNLLQEFHQSYKTRSNQIIEEEYTQGREINNYIATTYASLFKGGFITSDKKWDEAIVKELLLKVPNDGTLKYQIAERIELKKIRKRFISRFKDKFENQLKSYQ